jgi:hypothetical protein
MSDEFDDDMPPIEEEADDFKNFDPQAYLSKRGRVRKSYDDDFSNAPDISSRGARSAKTSRRERRQRYSDDMDFDNDGGQGAGIPMGIGAGILGMLESGNIGVVSELLRSFGPLAKVMLGVIGCALMMFCIVVCGGGFLLINALTRR